MGGGSDGIGKGIPNAEREKWNRALINAISNDNLEKAKCAIDMGADVNAVHRGWGSSNESALGYAARRYYASDILDYLIEKNAALDMADDDGNTPMIKALIKGYAGRAERLLNAGANPWIKNRKGISAFDIIVKNGYHNLMTKAKAVPKPAEQTPIVTKPTSIKKMDQRTLDKKLLIAARKGDLAGVTNALDLGADIEAKASRWHYNATPLLRASTGGHQDIVEFLLSRGADINVKDRDGYSCLHEAILRSHENLAIYLFEQGANSNTKTNSGKTLMYTAQENKMHAFIEHVSKETEKKRVEDNKKLAEMIAPLLTKPAQQEQPVIDQDCIRVISNIFGRKLEEIFNFKARERITYALSADGKVEAMTRQNFSDIDDTDGLKDAFEKYKNSGGKIPEENVFIPAHETIVKTSL